jgi:hypothetical protein
LDVGGFAKQRINKYSPKYAEVYCYLLTCYKIRSMFVDFDFWTDLGGIMATGKISTNGKTEMSTWSQVDSFVDVISQKKPLGQTI